VPLSSIADNELKEALALLGNIIVLPSVTVRRGITTMIFHHDFYSHGGIRTKNGRAFGLATTWRGARKHFTGLISWRN
jgi:hypothetical protein